MAPAHPLELIAMICVFIQTVQMERRLMRGMAKESADPVRFGAEFGPKRSANSTGVSLSTFKSLVWVSNLGGLLLFAIGLNEIALIVGHLEGESCHPFTSRPGSWLCRCHWR